MAPLVVQWKIEGKISHGRSLIRWTDLVRSVTGSSQRQLPLHRGQRLMRVNRRSCRDPIIIHFVKSASEEIPLLQVHPAAYCCTCFIPISYLLVSIWILIALYFAASVLLFYGLVQVSLTFIVIILSSSKTPTVGDKVQGLPNRLELENSALPQVKNL